MKSWNSKIVDGLRIVVVLTVISLGLVVVTHPATSQVPPYGVIVSAKPAPDLEIALTQNPIAIAELTVTPAANGSILVMARGLSARLMPNVNPGHSPELLPANASSFIACLTTVVAACTDPRTAMTFTALPPLMDRYVDIPLTQAFPAEANKPSTFYVVAYLVAPASGPVLITSRLPMVAQFIPGLLQ
jgi:hypothetical protein